MGLSHYFRARILPQALICVTNVSLNHIFCTHVTPKLAYQSFGAEGVHFCRNFSSSLIAPFVVGSRLEVTPLEFPTAPTVRITTPRV
jgi:hypothetical protein